MKNKIKNLCFTLAFIFVLSFVIIESFILISGQRADLDVSPDFLLILGAKAPSASLNQRLYTGLDFLLDNPDTKVIVSGGQGQSSQISEAQYMKSFLTEKGISSNRILLEDKSTNTLENLKFSLAIAKEFKDDDISFLITSNKYHIFRSKLLARRLGIKAYGLPAKVPPSTRLKAYTREYFAVIKSFIFDW